MRPRDLRCHETSLFALYYMELFHTLNRGVDKRRIFLDSQDYSRFVYDLYEFNDQERVVDLSYRTRNSRDIVSHETKKKKRKLLVNIHCFCLMPNHYHLLLSSKVENGISLFMKKLNIGYAKYFNFKYKRTGTLFEGRFKSVTVANDAHLLYLPYYIHLNPLDLIAPTWRERKINNSRKAVEFLENYRWSSYLDYIGKKNFPSVIDTSFLSEIIGSVDSYKKETLEWLDSMDLSVIKNLLLE